MFICCIRDFDVMNLYFRIGVIGVILFLYCNRKVKKLFVWYYYLGCEVYFENSGGFNFGWKYLIICIGFVISYIYC